MTIKSTPIAIEVPKDTNIDSLLRDRLKREPNSHYLEVNHNGAWTPMTVAEFNHAVVAAAKGLVALGVEPGDRVGIMSRTSYNWTLLDFAAWAAGAVPVPIYETSSPEQIKWIVSNSEISVLFCETEAHAAAVETKRDQMPSLHDVFVLDKGAIEMLDTIGEKVPDAEIERRRRLAGSDDLATIIYTSGTTGLPKGAELTHGNFVTLSLNTAHAAPEVFNNKSRTILFLPLAHVFARFIEVIALASGNVLAHSPDIKNLMGDIQGFKPTYLLGVPRIFEKIYNTAEQGYAAGGHRDTFNWATAVAIEYSRALDTPKGPSASLRAQHRLAEHRVYAKLRENLGGHATHAISGGGPLGERLGHFYRGIGINILEGYGLTENTAPTSLNNPKAARIGTVGQQIPGCSVKIADDGEIMLKGPHVFRGYHKNPEATAAAFDADGWFHTGDLGAVDDDGYLKITGRKKEIIVTAGGKNVAPAVLEDRVRAHALVSQCVVVGDNKPFIGALVTLDADGLPGWLKMHGKEPLTVVEAMHDPDVLESIDHAITRANEAVSKAESIRKWNILPGDLTIANGYLTPSMKVKRNVVLKDFGPAVEALYVDTRNLPMSHPDIASSDRHLASVGAGS